jgi:hypothetical protein
MQKRWTEKNVDLNKLAGYTEDFFKDKGFVTEKYESMEEHTILWAPPRDKKMSNATKVRIFGNPNDFVIEITASERSRRSIWLGLLTKSIGGGYLVLQDLKLREALEKIEKEFWVFIEDKIANLTGSAGHP